jgi:hypothetical protein
MLKYSPSKESSVYEKFVFGLYETTLASLLFKYARNTAYKIPGNAEFWERAGLLSF